MRDRYILINRALTASDLYWVEQSEGYWEQKEPSGLCLLAQQERALTNG